MKKLALIFLLITSQYSKAQITFCGEAVPVENKTVLKKLETAKKTMTENFFKVHDLSKTKRYLDYFAVALANKGIPEDFKYLPIVESLLSNAISPAGASGYWQLMPETAREMDLDVTYGYDERFNVIRSTSAAADFIKWLYSKTNNWTLTAAAYNCGAGNISKAQRKAGMKPYYFLPLPQETKDYVYRIIACKIIYESLVKPSVVDTEPDTAEVVKEKKAKVLDSTTVTKTERDKYLIVKYEMIGNTTIESGSTATIRFLQTIDALGIEKLTLANPVIIEDKEGAYYLLKLNTGEVKALIIDDSGNKNLSNKHTTFSDGKKYFISIKI